MDEAKKATDWERIEAQYRAGLLSVREIAAQHGVSHPAIVKRAKKEEWARDLQAKIKAKADELVTKATVTAAVTAETKAAERQAINDNAQAIADIRLGHRTDIKKGRNLVAKLLAELEGITDQPDLIEDLQQALYQAELGDDPDDITKQSARGRAQRLRDALERVVGLQGRVGSIKGLAEALKNLVALERQAWGIEDAAPANPIESMSEDDLEAEAARLRRLREGK